MAKRSSGRKRSVSRNMAVPTYKPPTMRQRMADHADSAARSVMEQHPMMKKMRSDMAGALMQIARGRGPAPRGRAKGIFS